MTEQSSQGRPAGGVHPASVLLRQIFVLNDAVEFHIRRHLNTNETDLQAMQLLMRHGKMTPTQLSEQLHLTAAATTTVIDRLVRREHACRVPHPEDRRRTLIKPIPDASEQVMGLILPMIRDADSRVRTMPDEAQEAVIEYLEGVSDSMQAFIDHLTDLSVDEAVADSPAITEKDSRD